MHRFFLPHIGGYTVGQHLELPQDPARQIRQVLRMRTGDSIVLLDDQGWQYDVVLKKVTRAVVLGEVVSRTPAAGEPTVRLTLYQAWLKRDNFEWVLQKGTELGVTRFVPLVTQRCVVRETAVKPNKRARWQRIIAEAAEQCERGRLPQLDDPLPFEVACAQAQNHDLALIAWEETGHGGVRQLLDDKPSGTVALFIGPEGGFTADEIETAAAHGIQAVTLGPRILRAETAAVVGTALIMQELEQLR